MSALASQKLVFVVEDEDAMAHLIRYNLEHAGHAVFTFASVADADNYMRTKRIVPDIFIIDWMLPGLTNGFQWCQQLRREEATKKIPIIMITARGIQIERELAIGIGVNEFLEKEVSQEELCTLVEKYLDHDMHAGF